MRAVSVAHPATQGLRIALTVGTSNVEPHANMTNLYNGHGGWLAPFSGQEIIISRKAPIVVSFLPVTIEVAKFCVAKNKRLINAC